jgi:glycosyltransferase involved in cell wall biosynthesis
MKKKILLITDSDRWALHYRAVALKKYLKEFNFEIYRFEDIYKYNINFNNYDIVYPLNWPIFNIIEKFIDKKRNYRLVTTVSSHTNRESAKEMKDFFNNFDKISVSSRILYKEFSPEIKGVLLTEFGADTDDFYPKNLPSENRSVFGWVGNSRRSVKRFSVVKDVFDSLKNHGISLKVATNKSMYGRLEMLDFYNSIGTLVCFSESEGTPNPILEASACGRAVLSTKVGNFPVLAGGMRNEISISTEDQMRRAILDLHGDAEKIDRVGRYLRGRVDRAWSWEIKSRAFRELFLQ